MCGSPRLPSRDAASALRPRIQVDRRDRVRVRHVHGHHGHDDRVRRDARAGAGVQREPVVDRVGRARVPVVARDLDPGVGMDRRPHRNEEGLSLRAGDVHARVRTVRSSAQPERARRVPCVAGRRWRHAHTRRHRDVVPRVPARRAGEGLDGVDHPYRPRARDRTDHRRLARHRRLVALDLLRQPAGRRRRLRARRTLPPRAQGGNRGAVRPRWVPAVGRGARARVVRPVGGAAQGLAVRDRVVDRHRGHRVVRAPRPGRVARLAPDARAPPLQGAHVPQREHRAHVGVRQLRGRALHPAAVPAGAARTERVAVGPHHVPAGGRRHRLQPARRPAVSPGRAAPAHLLGHGRHGGGHDAARVPGPAHRPLVAPVDHVRPRDLHGVRVRTVAGGDLRQHHSRGHRARLGDLFDPAPGRGRARCRHVVDGVAVGLEDRRRARRSPRTALRSWSARSSSWWPRSPVC